MPEIARPWRAVHRSLTDSERLASVSDGAWRLYVLLLLWQDDAGCYPWTRTMVRGLTVGTGWTDEQTEAFCTELVRTELVQRTDSVLTIRRGKELNGPPTGGAKPWQQPRYYDTSAALSSPESQVRTQYVPDTYSVRTTVDNKTVQKKPPKSPTGGLPTLTDDHRTRLHAKYDHALTPGGVDLAIGTALNHKASLKWVDVFRGVDNWLQRDADRVLAAPKVNGERQTKIPRTFWNDTMGLDHQDGAYFKPCKQSTCEVALCREHHKTASH